MEYVLLVYVFLKLEILNRILFGSSIFLSICLIIAAVAMIVRAIDDSYGEVVHHQWKPAVKILSWVSAIVFSMNFFLPSQKDAAILVATYYTASVAQSPEVQKVVTLAKTMANNTLDEAISKAQKK